MLRRNTPIKGFGLSLEQDQQEHHFLVVVPKERTLPVSISQHMNWWESEVLRVVSPGNLAYSLELRRADSVRALLSHDQWLAIANDVQETFNACLKHAKKRTARFKREGTLLSWQFGRELAILAWGIQQADPSLIPIALRNWRGLLPVERRWLYSRVAAHPQALTWRGEGRAWRKALQFLLTENPTSDGPALQTFDAELELRTTNEACFPNL